MSWLLFACCSLTARARAEHTASRMPRSAEVLDEGCPVYAGPAGTARRLGTVHRGTRLAWLGETLGADGGRWIRVDEGAWVAARHVRPSRRPPGAREAAAARPERLLPLPYAFVRDDATPVYRRPSDVLVGAEPVTALGKGFGVVVRGLREEGGAPLARVRAGWMELSALAPVRASRFRGVELSFERPLASVAWADPVRGAALRARPGGRLLGRVPPRARLRVLERRGRWVRVARGGWVVSSRIRAPALPARWPEGLGSTERWILVDRSRQTLVAFEGRRAVYATLVSTGRARTPTPAGPFRIWVKLAFDDMDDLERDDVASNYAVEQVPWVQYFEGGYGLHAAFWHDHFGRPRSHGCVNLAPMDARWLFGFTRPVLPPGWSAVLPRRPEQGTRVVVR